MAQMIAEKASLILTGLHVYNLVNDIFYSTPRESYVLYGMFMLLT